MKHFLTAAFCLASSMMMAQTGANDPVIMTIDGEDVPRSEFEYSYNKNNTDDVIDRKTVSEYVELFVNYKLKVREAMNQRMDTLPSYQKEFRQYRDMQLLPTLINDADVEAEAKQIYDNTKKSIGPDGLVRVSHVLVGVSQNADKATMAKAEQKADSLYGVLVAGADFAEIAKAYSQDPGSAKRGGELGWISKNQTLKAFEKAAFSLKNGEMSKPVLSEVGYHIIRCEGRKQLEPYDSLRADIYKFIERRNIRTAMANNRLQEIAKAQGKTTEEVMDAKADSISAVDQNMKYLIKEYHDGLLRFEVANRDVWEKAAKDEKGLQSFFKKNRKKYLVGEKQKKAKKLDEVRSQVVSDYQSAKEKEWEKQLRAKYPVTINQEVLKTVNTK